MKKIFIIAALLVFSNAQAQYKTKTFFYDEAEAVPREHSLDISHVLIDVAFDAPQGIVKGKATHTFTALRNPVDSVFFDAPGITILEALLDGQAVQYKIFPKGVAIFPQPALTWETQHQLTFRYEAQPRLGLYFIGWNDPENKSRKQIWTQGQAYDNRYWVPLYDKQNDKAITEVIVRFDAAYKVLSNGEKVLEKDNKDGTKTWQYRMTKPHSTYLIMIGIGKYDIEKRKSKSGVPINLWYYPEFPERVAWTYKYSAEMMDWMEQELGVKFPWTTYSQIPVQDYTFGAMENTTATLFGDFYLVDEGSYLDRAYLYVNAHELTHMWFGDLITERSETHHWLQESFATFYGNLYHGVARGQNYYDWSRKLSADQALEASVKDLYPIASSVAGTARHYPKGAVVLDMLRSVTGEDAFRRAIKHYLEKHAYGNVDTEDLLTAFHEKLGLSLDWFWEEWLYRGGEPKYEVNFREVTASGSRASEFTVTQTHEVNDLVNYFKMPITFEVYYKDGTVATKKEVIEKYQQVVQLPNPDQKEVDFVVFDPNMKLLKTVVFKKSPEMMAAQALKAKNMLDRYDAVLAMKILPIEQKIETLLSAFGKETFYGIKAEIISQLSGQTDERSIELLKKALADPDADVRKSVLANVKKIPETLIPDYERLFSDKSYQAVELALERLCIQNPAKAQEYLDKTKNIVGTRGSNVRIKWLELSALREAAYCKELASYAGPSYEFLTRSNAIASLKKLSYFDDSLLKNLFDAALNPNNKLSADASAALKYYYGQLAYRKRIEEYYATTPWNAWQKLILSKIFV